MVSKEDFHVNKFLGCGCYSLVYEVEKKTGKDSGKRYAFKKFFLLTSSAIRCVLRERHILVRLSDNEEKSPFLPTLYYSLWIPFSPVFVITESCGKDIYDLIQNFGFIQEKEAKFYITEIMCGLELIHSLGIIHLDIKPENVLFREDGHIFLADFDRSYDKELMNNLEPDEEDFTGTPLFMAPEIAKGQIITEKADIWSMGVLLAELVSGPIRKPGRTNDEDFEMARQGRYTIREFSNFTKGLKSFFHSCLKTDYKQRATIQMLRNSIFLKSTDWSAYKLLKIKPPYDPREFEHRPSKQDKKLMESSDENLLNDAFAKTPTYDYGSKRLKKFQENNYVKKKVLDEGEKQTEADLLDKFKDFEYFNNNLSD